MNHIRLVTLGITLVLLSGCTSMLSETTSAGAGIAGTAIASKVTDNATVATGIGLGVQAAASAGLKYVERQTRGEEQDAIASAAGPLQVGEVAEWTVAHTVPIAPDAYGQVTVSRLISGLQHDCKEIVFSTIDREADDPERERQFYISTICQDGNYWRWAAAEPATARWGALQ